MRMRSMPPPPCPANATMLPRTAAPRCGKARTRRKAAAPGLTLLFMPGNSGGIVGLTGARRAGTRRAGLGLGLATPEILAQRRAQAALLARLLRALSPLVHGLQDYDPTACDGSLPLRSAVEWLTLAPYAAVWQGSPHARPLPHRSIFAPGPALP